MNTVMVAFHDFDMRQKIVQFGVQTAGDLITAGVVVFLVSAWILTSPLIQLIDLVAGKRKVKTKEHGQQPSLRERDRLPGWP